MIRMIRMIILFRTPRLGPRISSPGRQGCRRPPRRPEVLKTLQFPLCSSPAALLSPLSEISHKVPTTGKIVCVFLGNINGWRNIVLQTAATATLCAWDGQIILTVRMISS